MHQASILDLPALDPRSAIDAGTARWRLDACWLSGLGGECWLLAACVAVFVDAECWMLAGRCRMLLTQEAKSPRAAQPYHNQSQPSTWCCTLLRPKGLIPVRLARFSALWQPPPASGGGRSDPSSVKMPKPERSKR